MTGLLSYCKYPDSSGLQCARQLVDTHKVDANRILILEAQDYAGGRVSQDPMLGCDIGRFFVFG